MNKNLFRFLHIMVLLIGAQWIQPECRAQVEEVYLTPHFHYDPVFQEDQNDYTAVGFDRCRRFLADLAADPDYAVVFSEIDYMKPFFDAFPEERADVLTLIAGRRIETGGSYSEPNELSIGGEGIIRNILYGRAYHEGVLGDTRAGVYMPFDVFGHSMQLTQILAKTRYQGCIWRKGNPPTEKWVGVTVPGLPPDFMSVAPDGSTLHHRREHYKAISGTKSLEQLTGDVMRKIRTQEALGWRADFATLSSADFAYPEPWLAGHGAALKAQTPSILLSGPLAYFEAIKRQSEAEGKRLPEVARDFSLYHAGTALTRVNLKMANRYAENALLSAEKYSAMAALLGARYPEAALDKAWRQVIFNQHHDGITGTCNDRSYFDMMGGYREALELAAGVRDNAAAFLAKQVNTAAAAPAGAAESFPIVVFNPLGHAHTGVVSLPWMQEIPAGISFTDSSGAPVDAEITGARMRGMNPLEFRYRFVARGVPPMGHKTYYMSVDRAAMNNSGDFEWVDESGPAVIENEFFRVAVDPARGGAVTDLLDKQANRRIVDADSAFPGNELIVLQEDRGPQYPAWELSTTGVKDMSSKRAAEVRVKRRPVSQTIEVRGSLPGLGDFLQEIILYKGIKRIDFVTTIANPASVADENDRNLWMVRFPARLNGTAPVVEDRFFAAARRRSLEPLSYRTDLEKMLTQSAPYSAGQWVEEGAAVRLDILDPDGKTADALALQLCGIVHTAAPESVAAAQSLQRALIQRGVSCTPAIDSENQNADLLNRNFRFVLDIAGDNAYAAAALKGKRREAYTQWLAETGTAKILFEALANDLNIKKVTTLAIGAKDAAAMGALIADITETIKRDARIRISNREDTRGKSERAAPDDYGIALINQGTILHSFDGNGAIVMGLFHSAQWAKDLMGTPFTFPENKTHRFTYSLYPHQGDWRAADTWKAAQEVNAPLSAAMTDIHPGPLPAVGSFINITSDSVALSAVKAAGNPLAFMQTAVQAGPHRGVVIRLNETEGKPDTATLEFFRPVKAVWRANMIEEKTGDAPLPLSGPRTLKLDIGPNAVETIVVEFADAQPAAPGAPALGPESEPPGAIFSKYWDYNLGAAYMRNSPVTVSVGFPPGELLDPEQIRLGIVKAGEPGIGKGENRLRLAVSNNSADARLKGRVTVSIPQGWSAEPDVLGVDLGPLEFQTVDLTVHAERPVESGWVRADFLSDAGERYFDALRIRQAAPLDATAETAHSPDRLIVRLRNNQQDRITGAVMPVTPMEAWPEALSGGVSFVSGFDRAKQFDLAAGETADLEFGFRVNAPDLPGAGRFWIMVKILYNGEFLYIPVHAGSRKG
jgi:hypothetical protein